MTTSEQVRKDLYQAAEYIEAHGWCQYSLLNEAGQACLQGAVSVAIFGIDMVNSEERYEGINIDMRDREIAASQVLADYVRVKHCRSVPEVNDNVLTSGEQAAALLREAADD